MANRLGFDLLASNPSPPAQNSDPQHKTAALTRPLPHLCIAQDQVLSSTCKVNQLFILFTQSSQNVSKTHVTSVILRPVTV